jgi:hypothetical protein
MGRVLYALAALLIIGTYAWADFNGRELRPSRRRTLARQTVRGGVAGATSYWYSGYHGGK